MSEPVRPDRLPVYHPDPGSAGTNGHRPAASVAAPAGPPAGAPHSYLTAADYDGDGEEAAPVRPPWRFALCAAYPKRPDDQDNTADTADTADDNEGSTSPATCGSDEVDDDEGDDRDGLVPARDPVVETLPPEAVDVLDLEEIVLWGQESAEVTFVHGRNPHTGRVVTGSFPSAEAARTFYSRIGPLRTIYC